MSGVCAWKTQCPQHVEKALQRLQLQSVHFDITESGNGKFVLKGLSKSTKVSIGNPHKCECKKEQPCIHTLAILTNYFRLDWSDPTIFQSGLSEIILMELYNKGRVNQDKLSACMLCKEQSGNMASCKACNQNYHWKCVELAAKVRGSAHACPRCGVKVEKSSACFHQQCSNCTSQLSGGYKCLLCTSKLYFLCVKCYRDGKAHAFHPFSFETNAKPPSHNEESVSALQFREIDPEDYDTLLRLDEASNKEECISDERFNLMPVRLCSSLEVGSYCAICLSKFNQHSECVVLPCEHILHVDCGRNWLTKHKNVCPIDNTKIAAGP